MIKKNQNKTAENKQKTNQSTLLLLLLCFFFCSSQGEGEFSSFMMKQFELPNTFVLLSSALHTQSSPALQNPSSHHAALTTLVHHTTQLVSGRYLDAGESRSRTADKVQFQSTASAV